MPAAGQEIVAVRSVTPETAGVPGARGSPVVAPAGCSLSSVSEYAGRVRVRAPLAPVVRLSLPFRYAVTVASVAGA